MAKSRIGSDTKVVAALAMALVANAGAFAQGTAIVDEFKPDIVAFVDKTYPTLDPLYKDIHAHPELGFQEVRTAALLAKRMRELGFEVAEQVGKTGIVAIFKNGPGPMVMVRTELDALPMEEKTGLPYASHAKATFAGRETFVDHSCGHDVHMAAWVGAAATLVALKDRWHGTLMFIGQPSEEQVSGAQAMIDDGVFKRFGKPDFAFALHTSPEAYGVITYGVGAISSTSDGLVIVFHGRGGHGSAPHKTIDPILMASRFVVDLQSVISRERDPFEFGVVSIGAIEGGSAGNIIPDTVTLRGTIRSYKPEVRARLHDGIRRTALGVAAMAGAPAPDISIEPGGVAVINDDKVVARTEATLKAAFGDKVFRVPPITASEDFSAFVNQGIPSMMFSIGVYEPARVAEARRPGGTPLPSNHSPYFAPVPEPTIKTGIEAMTLAVLTALRS
jgi:hippurate hydrolase